MKTIARNVVTGRCERCGRMTLLDVVMDHLGRQMFLCERCTTTAEREGLSDPLENIQWPKKHESGQDG